MGDANFFTRKLLSDASPAAHTVARPPKANKTVQGIKEARPNGRASCFPILDYQR